MAQEISGNYVVPSIAGRINRPVMPLFSGHPWDGLLGIAWTGLFPGDGYPQNTHFDPVSMLPPEAWYFNPFVDNGDNFAGPEYPLTLTTNEALEFLLTAQKIKWNIPPLVAPAYSHLGTEFPAINHSAEGMDIPVPMFMYQNRVNKWGPTQINVQNDVSFNGLGLNPASYSNLPLSTDPAELAGISTGLLEAPRLGLQDYLSDLYTDREGVVIGMVDMTYDYRDEDGSASYSAVISFEGHVILTKTTNDDEYLLDVRIQGVASFQVSGGGGPYSDGGYGILYPKESGFSNSEYTGLPDGVISSPLIPINGDAYALEAGTWDSGQIAQAAGYSIEFLDPRGSSVLKW